MSNFTNRPWRSGRLVSSAIQELFEPVEFRRDTLGLPRETKVFGGLRATTTAGSLYPDYFRALTGQAATTARGTLVPSVRFMEFDDTFTGTNGASIIGHVPDFWTNGTGTWTAGLATGTAPTINTNRMRGAGTAVAEYVAVIDEPTNVYQFATIPRQYIEASFYRQATATGGAANQLTEAIGFCATAGTNGYFFGWAENTDTWELKKLSSSVFGASLGSSTTGAFTGTGQTRVLKLEVREDTAGSGNDHIICSVDGTVVIDVTSSGSFFIFNNFCDYGAVHFAFSGSVDIDRLQYFEIGTRLPSYRITTAQGTLTPSLAGPGATLTGLAATTNQGIFVFGASGALSGNVATTAFGTMVPYIGAGVDATYPIPANVPSLTATVLNNASGGSYVPGYMYSSLIGYNGTLYGAGQKRQAGFSDTYRRQGPYTVSQTSALWTLGNNDATTYLDVPSTGVSYFRITIKPNHFYNLGGGIVPSLTADGTMQTLTSRFYSNNVMIESYAAWQGTDLSSNSYDGPELYLGRAGLYEYSLGAMGFYGYRADRAIVFYPRKLSKNIAGINGEVAGFRVFTAGGVLLASKFENVGQRATASQGILVRDPADGNVNAGAALTGLVGTTSFGLVAVDTTLTGIAKGVALTGNLCTLNTFLTKLGPLNTSVTYVPAFRVAKIGDVDWSDEVLVDTQYMYAQGAITIPSGYGDLIYVVYSSSLPVATGITPTYSVGLAVIDCATRTVVSNVLTAEIDPIAEAGNPGSILSGSSRTVAEVVVLGNGTSITQFLFRGNVINLSWTAAAKNTPTLTLKNKPSGYTIVPRWDTLEYRNDTVKHVLYTKILNSGRYLEAIDAVLENDATGTGSTWTSVNTAYTGGSNLGGRQLLAQNDQFGNPEESGNYVSGYGGGKFPSFLYVARSAAQDPDGSSKVKVDYWATAPAIFSMQMSARVGQVGTNITPNAALTGLRATTTSPSFPYITAGANREVIPYGKKATALAGITDPPRITFLSDTFTGVDLTQLTAHTGEIGATWTRAAVYSNNIVLVSNKVQYDSTIATNANVVNIASGVSPIPDYRIDAVGTFSVQSVWYADSLNGAIGVRCTPQGTGGYWFGACPGDGTWLLTKGALGGTVLARSSTPSSGGWSGTYSVEVSGQAPTRIQCFVDGVRVIDYSDTSSDPYYLTGNVGVYFQDLIPSVSATINSINAFSYDPTANPILLGSGIVTGQGQLVVAGGLTGQRATTAAGQLDPTTPTISVALTGYAATTAQGVIFPVQGEGILVGQVATTGYGAVVPPTFVPLIGQRATLTPGIAALLNRELLGLQALTIRGDVTPSSSSFGAFVGAAVTAVHGVLVPLIDKNLTGSTATSGFGLTGTATSPILGGFQLATSRGVLTPFTAYTIPLVGLAATGVGGTLQVAASTGVILTGQAAVATVGTMVGSTGVTLTFTGRGAITGQGVLSPIVAVTPLGRQAVTAQGVLQLLTNIFLTGRSAGAVAGVVGQTHDANIQVAGISMTMQLGVAFMPTATDYTLLWRAVPDTDVFTHEGIEENFVQT